MEKIGQQLTLDDGYIYYIDVMIHQKAFLRDLCALSGNLRFPQHTLPTLR